MMETMDRGSLYDHDIPSLSASLEAFDPERSTHSAFGRRSALQSSSRWSAQEEESEPESEGPWAPPAWQRANNNWYRKSLLSESAHAMRASPAKSTGSCYDRTERDVTPSRIPLPESPLKQTPRTSPEPMPEQGQRHLSPDNIASRMQSPSVEPQAGGGAQESAEDGLALSHHEEQTGSMDGCMRHLRSAFRPLVLIYTVVRFAIRGETLFRTEPVENIISSVATGLQLFTKSRLSIICTLSSIIIAYLLTIPWNESLIPDIANVANMAKQFEPLMYASENVIPRSRELADASIAVQDLGESVRVTNMSASKVIIEQLDGLGDSLKVLSENMASFFTNVDGDMDS
jgi:hypothetical protein